MPILFWLAWDFPILGGLPWWLRQSRVHLQCRRPCFNPRVRNIPWRREWLFFPGEFHGEKSLAGYSPWGGKESDTTEQLTLSLFFFFHFPSFRPESPTSRETPQPQKNQGDRSPYRNPHLISRAENRAANRAASPSAGLGPQSQM